MSNIKLSIITINYNNLKGLQKTFDSVSSQTWKNFEYIVVDGGSQDGGKELIEKNDRVTKWVSEKDSGVYNAMNKGIKMASGDYVIFMNSGDFFYDDNVLEKIHHNFDSGIGVLYGDSVYFNDSGYRREETPPKKLTFGFFFYGGINHQAAFIKRDLFYKHFFYNEEFKICSDWEFFIYVLCSKNESYLHLDQYICFYDFSGISADPKNLELYHKEREITLKKYFPLMLDEFGILDELRSKRIQQVLYIKKHKITWRILKWMISILLAFLPKKQNNFIA